MNGLLYYRIVGLFWLCKFPTDFDIEECRNLAIQNNKNYRCPAKKVKAANEERKAAFTKYFPQLSAMGGYMWNQKISICWIWTLEWGLGSALGPASQLCFPDN